jgi:uncharacterized peroxidase-related enzyme
MAFIETIADEHADGAVAEMYGRARETSGFVPNMVRAFSLRPEVWAAWEQLKAAIMGRMDLRRYELATFGAARSLKSSYCMLAHGQVLADRFFDPGAVRAIAIDHDSAGLDEAEVAVMDFAEKVAAAAGQITEADVQRLRDVGLDDHDIFDVAAAAAARCFFSKMLDSLGALPDAAYEKLDPGLREALVIGRPIEEV